VWETPKPWPWFSLADGKDPDDRQNSIMLNKEDKPYRVINTTNSVRNDTILVKNSFTYNDLTEILYPLVDNSMDPPVGKRIDSIDPDTKNIFRDGIDYIIHMITNNIKYALFKTDKYRHVLCPNINSCPIKLNHTKLYYYIKHVDYYFFSSLVDINFGGKSMSHSIEIDFFVKFPKKMVKIFALKIVGENPENYELANGLTTHNLKIYNSDVYSPEIGYYKSSEDDRIYTPNDMDSKNYVDKYIHRQRLSGSEKFYNEYTCYGSTGNNQIECESTIDMYYRPKSAGVWDRKCSKDSECPFYKANKNYKNKRGGCFDGVCEMPVGITRLGNRYFDIDSKPKCYNSKDNICRGKNPDYMFENDYLIRLFNLKTLNSNGLDLM
jgi:hypothetical protein